MIAPSSAREEACVSLPHPRAAARGAPAQPFESLPLRARKPCAHGRSRITPNHNRR